MSVYIRVLPEYKDLRINSFKFLLMLFTSDFEQIFIPSVLVTAIFLKQTLIKNCSNLAVKI